jgi:hypothetical protein
MTKRFTLSIGLNDKDTKVQKISTIEAYKTIENVIVEKLGGGSIFEGRGIYKHDDGQIVIENSLMVQLYDCPQSSVLEVSNILKAALNQESIILTSEEVNSQFI